MPDFALFSRFLLLSITVTLGACQDDSQYAPFEHYLSRLSTTLGEDAPPFAQPSMPSPPRVGGLKLEISGSRLGALDFLALHGCEVQITISKRNSSLGRFARDSQRLLLELEFLRLAPACVNKLRTENKADIGNLLQEAWEQKHEQLPALIFNATLGSEEFRYFWQTSKRLGTYPAVGDNSVEDSLNTINTFTGQWLSGSYQADNPALELALGKIAGGAGGALLNQLVAQSTWLNNANQMLENRLQRGPLCAKGLRHREADILPNVVRRFFVEGIQPRSAILNKRRYALYTPVENLESQLRSVLPTEYLAWQKNRDQLLDIANNAPKKHVMAIQEMLRGCETESPANW